MKSIYTEYECWGPGSTDYPPRSSLFSLAPVGIGTGQAESLTSYIMRLAEAHCVSVATFYRQVIYPAARADAEKQGPAELPCPVSMEGITKVGHCLNGLYSNAANPVRALERLTWYKGCICLPGCPGSPSCRAIPSCVSSVRGARCALTVGKVKVGRFMSRYYGRFR